MFQYLEDPSFNLHLHYDKKQKYPPSILNYQISHADLLYLNFSDCPNKCLLHFFFLFWTNSTLWNSTVDLLLRSLFTKWKQRPEKSEMLVLWIIWIKFHSAIHLKGWKESHKVVVAYSLYQAEGQLEKFSEHLKKCLKTSKVCKFEMPFFFFFLLSSEHSIYATSVPSGLCVKMKYEQKNLCGSKWELNGHE